MFVIYLFSLIVQSNTHAFILIFLIVQSNTQCAIITHAMFVIFKVMNLL